MKKSKILGILINLIVLLLFNALYFGIGGAAHSASAWIAYGFIHFSYVMIIATPYMAPKGRTQAIYTASMFAITSAYIIVELVVGGIIIVAHQGHKFSLFSQLIIAAIYLIILFTSMIADEHTSKAVEKHEAELIYVKESCSMLKSILSDVSDKQLYRKVEKVFDLIQSSPVKSAPNVQDIESLVMNEIDNLNLAVRNGDTAAISDTTDKITRLASERNRLLRLVN